MAFKECRTQKMSLVVFRCLKMQWISKLSISCNRGKFKTLKEKAFLILYLLLLYKVAVSIKDKTIGQPLR